MAVAAAAPPLVVPDLLKLSAAVAAFCWLNCWSAAAAFPFNADWLKVAAVAEFETVKFVRIVDLFFHLLTNILLLRNFVGLGGCHLWSWQNWFLIEFAGGHLPFKFLKLLILIYFLNFFPTFSLSLICWNARVSRFLLS